MNTDGYVEVGIQELRMRPGTELKILDNNGRLLNHKSQFVAVFSGKSMLISLLVDNPRKIDVNVGESYNINVFNGKYEFSFTANALQVNEAQFNALLSCPDTVTVKFVRKHLRAKLSLPATISSSETNTAVIITDLSGSGAGINSAQAIGNIGDRANLALQIEVEKRKINLNLISVIKHVTESETGSGLLTGVEFESVNENDKLALYYYVSTHSEAELTR